MDKNKIIEAAAKLVAKGAYDKAIKEYQKILDADPKDVRILQKMGELFQKKNDAAQAAQYFTRVAESYTTDGFFLKAVALYKQVLKLDPSLIDINIKLAELHQHLQLLGEAMAYYQIVANHHDKQGDTRASLEVLKKMVDLDPDNVASRVKLADLYVREGLNGEAMGEFQRAAEHLKRSNRIDDYLRVAERLSAMDPNNLGLARELAELYLQRNDQKRALAKLQVCFKADSRDIETLRLLAVAFQGLGQTSKTISVYKELARAHEDRGQQDEAERVWQQVAQLDPNDADVQARAAAHAPPPAAPPMPVPSAAATAASPAYQPAAQAQQATAVQATHAPAARPKADNISKLLTETDVYVKYGLHDKALEHLRKVFAVEPENIDAHEKAYAIYVASNNHAQAFEQLLNVLRLHTRSGDGQRAQPYLAAILQQNPGHPEVPVFLSALRVAGGAPGAAPAEQDSGQDDAILVDSSDDEVIVADEPDEVISAEVAVTGDEVVEEAALADEPLATDEELMMTPADAAVAARVDVEPPPVAGYGEPDAQDQVVSDFEQEYAAPQLDDAEPSTGEFPVAELEEQDAPTGGTGIPATTAPGYQFEAPPGLGDDEHEAPTRVSPRLDPSMLRTTAGVKSPVLAKGRAAPAPVEDEPEAEPPTGVSGVPEDNWSDVAPAAEEPVEAPPEEETASEECDEATFFIEQGLYDEAREILDTILIAYPDHPRATQLMAQLEQAAASGAPPTAAHDAGGNGAAGSRDAFDLAAELANELGDFSQEQAAPDLGGGAGGDDYQVSVEEVFAEFKKGLEKVVKPEDVDTHYDLGVAYKEMGLIDDAVSEFSIARKGCVGKRKEIDCLSMIGLLQTMKGDFAQAVEAFAQALQTEHASGDVEKALRYDLASAYEGGGQNGRALGQYLRVQALDGNFRDVGAHVERLSAIAVPEDDEGAGGASPPQPPGGGRPPSGGGRPARKVGYV
ncbi:MAG: tetratricopeptide repeat protein [Myxococcota bacterium]